MATLKKDIAAYASMRSDLETEHLGEWVLIHNEKLIGTYESFAAAADESVQRFGRGPYLIREIGAPLKTLPASVLYRPLHAES